MSGLRTRPECPSTGNSSPPPLLLTRFFSFSWSVGLPSALLVLGSRVLESPNGAPSTFPYGDSDFFNPFTRGAGKDVTSRSKVGGRRAMHWHYGVVCV